MGCDGGSIPKRSELVKTASQKDGGIGLEDPLLALHDTYSQCHVSGVALSNNGSHVAVDMLGRLFDREKLVEASLEKAKKNKKKQANEANTSLLLLPPVLSATVVAHLTANPLYSAANQLLQNSNRLVFPFICPLSGKEMNGRSRFIAVFSCGCVMSHDAFKQTTTSNDTNSSRSSSSSASASCPVCSTPIPTTTLVNYIIPIYSTDQDEIKTLRANMNTYLDSLKQRKRDRKREKLLKKLAKLDRDNSGSSDSDSSSGGDHGNSSKKKQKTKDKKMMKTKSEDTSSSQESDADDNKDKTSSKKSSSSTHNPNININLPKDLSSHLSAKLAAHSDAIKTLYRPADSDKTMDPQISKEKSNWLTMGTFNRYA